MSIMDLKLELSDAQALTVAATGILSTNYIKLAAAKLAVGDGTPLYVNVRVHTAFTGADTTSSGTLKVHLAEGANSQCSDADILTKTMVNASAGTALTAGKWIMRVPIPYGVSKQFLRLRYVNSSADTAFTAGKVDAWISGATPETNVGT